MRTLHHGFHLAQAKGMPCGIQHHCPVLGKLLISDCRAAFNSVGNRFLQIVNGEIQVRHLLLGSRFFRPHRRYIFRVPLKGDTWIGPLLRARSACARPIFCVKGSLPLKQRRVEFGQFIRFLTVHRKGIHFDFQPIIHRTYTSRCRIFVPLVSSSSSEKS